MSIIIKIFNFIESKIEFSKFSSYGTTIFNILDNTTELLMTKYIIGEFFSSGRATLNKNPSDQTVPDILINFYFRYNLSTTEHKLQFTFWLLRFIFTSVVFILGIKAPGIRQRNQLIHQGLYFYSYYFFVKLN